MSTNTNTVPAWTCPKCGHDISIHNSKGCAVWGCSCCDRPFPHDTIIVRPPEPPHVPQCEEPKQ